MQWLQIDRDCRLQEVWLIFFTLHQCPREIGQAQKVAEEVVGEATRIDELSEEPRIIGEIRTESGEARGIGSV